jgi:hypothetical protein
MIALAIKMIDKMANAIVMPSPSLKRKGACTPAVVYSPRIRYD